MFNEKSIELLKLFLPSSSHYCKAMSLISLQLNCLTVPAFCYDADVGAIVSSKVHLFYL